MAKAFGIINTTGNHIWVEGMQEYRPIGAFSFLGKYRVIDFSLSNMSNSGIDRIHVIAANRPRSLTEHIGSGRHYNINSKKGNVQILFTENQSRNSIYNTDIAVLDENLADSVAKMTEPYVVVAPSHIVFKQDFKALLAAHEASGADVTLLYHSVENANEAYLNCDYVELNRQKGVLAIAKNRGNEPQRDIFLDTYDEAGIFAFLGILGYILISINHLCKCISDDTLDFGFRQIVLCVYVICYIEFMVEPILQGMSWFFASFCLIDGYVSRILRHNKNVTEGGIAVR